MAGHRGSFSRRRFISIAAAAATGLTSFRSEARQRQFKWRGVALGAVSEIQLACDDEQHARNSIQACRREIDRLENIFSLYREASTLSRLNREGHVDYPEFEFVELLSAATQYSEATDGAFDVTVQPLWQLYKTHFSDRSADAPGPDKAHLDRARALVDFHRVEISPRRVAFSKDGMALTLNGIAQGFVTDLIGGLLKRSGFADMLIHVGEIQGFGNRTDGTPWQVGIADPLDTSTNLNRVDLLNRSIATSSPAGYRFRHDGRHHHLIDPRTGTSPNHYRTVSVIAPTATMADAFSTAFSVMRPSEVKSVVAGHNGLRAILIEDNGNVSDLSSSG